MTVADQLKIIDIKIKSNQARYDVDRFAAKMSALSSIELGKYEYLTGEDLGCKPNLVEQAKFENSLLSKFLNKGLKEEDKKYGPLKMLKISKIKVKSSWKQSKIREYNNQTAKKLIIKVI